MSAKREYSLPSISRQNHEFQQKIRRKLPVAKCLYRLNASAVLDFMSVHKKNQSAIRLPQNSTQRLLVYDKEYKSGSLENRCFLYKFSKDSRMASRDAEFENFLETCQKQFHSIEKYCYVYSSSGLRIFNFSELQESDQYLVVCIEPVRNGKKRSRISLLKKKHISHDFSSARSKIHLKRSFITRLDESIDNKSIVSLTSGPKKLHKELSLLNLKLKLGEAAVQIDTKLPKLTDLGIFSLITRYKLKESELHRLYARYKILVLLSFSQNPSHDIQKGISKEIFVNSFTRADENSKTFLRKIISAIDQDSNDCIDLHEFFTAMNILIHGSHNEQIDMFFSVYDTDKNGTLSFAEIKVLCKMQLFFAGSDEIMDYLAESFASLIFDMAGVGYTEEISAGRLKSLIESTEEKLIIEMFCSFNI